MDTLIATTTPTPRRRRWAAVLAVAAVAAAAWWWSSRPPLPIRRVLTTPGVYPLAISPDGRTLALGQERGGLLLHDLETGAERRLLEGPRDFDFATFSPDGRTIGLSFEDRAGVSSEVRAVDLRDGTERVRAA